jgi:hypothetical protein
MGDGEMLMEVASRASAAGATTAEDVSKNMKKRTLSSSAVRYVRERTRTIERRIRERQKELEILSSEFLIYLREHIGRLSRFGLGRQQQQRARGHGQCCCCCCLCALGNSTHLFLVCPRNSSRQAESTWNCKEREIRSVYGSSPRHGHSAIEFGSRGSIETLMLFAQGIKRSRRRFSISSG